MLADTGAAPVLHTTDHPNPEVSRIVRTTQTLITGHTLHLDFNYRKRIAEYTLLPPCAGVMLPPLAHGHLLLPEKFAPSEQFFQKTAQTILSRAVEKLEATFPIYSGKPNFG